MPIRPSYDKPTPRLGPMEKIRQRFVGLPSISWVLFGRRRPWRANQRPPTPDAPTTPGPSGSSLSLQESFRAVDPTFLPTPFTNSPRFTPRPWLPRLSREWWLSENQGPSTFLEPTHPPEESRARDHGVIYWTRHEDPELYQSLQIGQRIKLYSGEGTVYRYHVGAFIGSVGQGTAIWALPLHNFLPPAVVFYLPRGVELTSELETQLYAVVDVVIDQLRATAGTDESLRA